MQENTHLFKKQTEAKLFYSKLGQVSCPGLNGEVVLFNAVGMRHLIRKGSVLRSAEDQIRRFHLLRYAVPILSNPQPIIVHRRENVREVTNRHGEKIILQTTADFWSFSEIKGSRLVTVVVRQIEKGQKHFFSIMSGRNKFKKLKPH